MLSRPLIMGVINATPDSFSDGAKFATSQQAIDYGLQLLEEVVDILDIGGESTRPNAASVSEAEELDRVMPIIEGLVSHAIPLSIDTSKVAVMREAIRLGVDMVNDVNALEAEGALELIVPTTVAVCLMHKQGSPATMQQAPVYHDVVQEVTDFLRQHTQDAIEAGIKPQRIVIDPGFGFGKTLTHNLALFKSLAQFKQLGFPVMVGLSRKSMLGHLTGRVVGDRVYASVAAALLAVAKGAAVVRVHDVKATRDALAIFNAIENHD